MLALRETNVPSTPETDKRKMLLLAWKALVKWEQKEMGGQKRWLGGEVWAVVWEMGQSAYLRPRERETDKAGADRLDAFLSTACISST